jgi:hypothetical protein
MVHKLVHEEMPLTLSMFTKDELRFFHKHNMLRTVAGICLDEWEKANIPPEEQQERLPF